MDFRCMGLATVISDPPVRGGVTDDRALILPVRGLSVLKTDSRGCCIPCHADVVEDLVRRVAAPATKAKFY